MLILLGGTQQYYGAINKGQFFGTSDIISIIPIAEARKRWEIVTVTGVLTVSDQFAGSLHSRRISAIAVLIKQFMVLDYLK
jgi:hypothetical protein